MRILRYLADIFIYLLLLAILAGGSAYFLFATPAGLRTSLGLVAAFVPGKLQYASVRGELDHSIAIEKLNYTNDGTHISIDSLSWSWDLSKLRHMIIVRALSAQGVHITVPQNASGSSGHYWQWLGYFNILHADIRDLTYADTKISQFTIKQNETNHHSFSMEMTGSMAGYPVQSLAQIQYEGESLEIQNARLIIANVASSITGTIKAAWNINWKISIPDLKAVYSDLHGSLNSTGSITGPRTAPEMHAQIDAQELMIGEQEPEFNVQGNLAVTAQEANFTGNVNIPRLNIALKTIALKAASKDYVPSQFTGTFQSGTGTGSVNGTIAKGLQLSIKGKDLQLANLKNYKINISPDMTLDYANNHLSINGTIDIPDATITNANFNDVVTLPGEVEFINEEEQEVTLPLGLDLQLQLRLGPKIHVAYDNLTANLLGKLKITQQTGSLPVAAGELHTTNGVYQAYNKKLDIQNGRIIYTGNALTNPGLDIRATQTIKTVALGGSSQYLSSTELKPAYTGSQTITVGVAVNGSLKKPIISLFSDAELNQDDILSYLVFGYPRSQITTTSGLALLNALAAGGKISGLGSIPGQIQNALGLNELSLGTAETFDPGSNTINNTTTFNIGKQIGKKLFLHYSVGLTDSLQILNLRYQFNKNLSLQSETSTLENGADLFYVYER